MADATKTVQMPVSAEQLWKVILDYEKYPEFVEGCTRAKVVKKDGDRATIEYGVSLLSKDIHYTLEHVKDSAQLMRWTMLESNILKDNHGSWELKPLGSGLTEVTYRLGLEFKIYVPGMILSGLVKSSLPKMLENFERRAIQARA